MSYSVINALEREPLAESYWFQEGPGVRNWQFTTSGVKLLNVGNITTTGSLDLAKTSIHLSHDEVFKSYKHFLLDAGDLVIASSGISFDTDGLLRTKMAFVSQKELPLCLNTSTIRFKSKNSERASIQFLRFWFDSQDFRLQITRLVTGSAQQNFGPSHLKQLTIPLPLLPEQKRIAAILDKADRLRRQRRFAQTISDSFLQSVFIKMFGDPAINPKNWTINPVDDVLSKKRAGTRTGPFGSSLKRHEYVESGIPVWQINNLRPNEFLEADPLFITENKYASLKNYSVEKGDILISRAGTVGTMCVATSSIQPSIIGTNLVRVVLNTDKVLPVFFSSLFTYFPGRVGNLRMSGDDGAYSFLNPGTLRTIPIPIPPLPLQEKFVAIVQKFERIRRQQREATRQAEHLFQTLLHRAFRGEL